MSHQVSLAVPLLATFLALCSTTAAADTLAERAGSIEAAIGAGDGGAALDQMRAFHHEVAARAGFGVRQAMLTEAAATGYGIYTPRPESVYAPGATVYGYVEPFGYSLQTDAQGLNAMLFDIDFALQTSDGEPLTDLIPMGAVELTSHNRPLDAYFHLAYEIDGPEGDYLIWTRVTDRPSGRQAEFTLPVTFRAAATSLSK